MVLYEKGGDVAEKETEVKTPAKRSAKSGYDAEEQAEKVRDKLAESTAGEPESSATSEQAIAKQAIDFHDANVAQPWYQLLLKAASEA